ncbi:efflux transporter outer membrane subunit [Ralstonia solanacearum]|uniref:efflux transporter outer membrane subunit n=1 Tax=Ralstonia solanacearum TaxID=305 RepID=UPI003CC511F0
MRTSTLLMLSAAATAAAALGGCAVGPDFKAPAPPAASGYTAQPLPAATASAPVPGGEAQRLAEANVPADWWHLFQSPALDVLVDEALRASPTVAQATARLRQAQAEAEAQFGEVLPSVDGTVSAVRQQVNPEAFGFSTPKPGPFTLYSASLSVSYALDLFGGVRRALEASRAQVDTQRYELEAARLSLAGNVVTAVVRVASLDAQIATTQRLLAAQRDQLAITERRFGAGGVARVEVLSQRTLLAQTEATLPPLAQQAAQARHRLSVLLGREPGAGLPDLPALDGLRLPDPLPVSLPSTLAQRRPDIRAAEAMWHEASANVGVVTANLFPRITLSAGLGSETTGFRNLLGAGSSIWNLGGSLTQPLFHGGTLRARKREAEAAYDAAGAAYRQAVLLGLQEVADALHAVHNDARALQARALATDQATQALRAEQARYAAGGISTLALLDAQRQVDQAMLQQVQSRADRLLDSAALMQALGGGW